MSEDYINKIIKPNFYGYGSNICFDCDRACGGCSWSEVNPETGRVKFEPIPGWKTVKKSRKNGRKWEVVEQIVECPLFVPTVRKN